VSSGHGSTGDASGVTGNDDASNRGSATGGGASGAGVPSGGGSGSASGGSNGSANGGSGSEGTTSGAGSADHGAAASSGGCAISRTPKRVARLAPVFAFAALAAISGMAFVRRRRRRVDSR
jgi:hypothetical protein